MLLLVPTAQEARALLDSGSPASERPVAARLGGHVVQAALCGFGLAAAGALSAMALQRSGERHCVLAGLGGSYDAVRLPVGALLAAREVRCADVGSGSGSGFRSAAELGFPQAPGGDGLSPVGDALPLVVPPRVGGVVAALLTVANASGGPAEAAERARRHDGALAEDMEGFAVAVACRRLGVELTILRGVSNVAGDRDRSHWDLAGGLAAARGGLLAMLGA